MISDSKLKIMLTSDDMKEYSLDCSTLDYENTETRRAFWSILDEAKHRTGFDAASEKVFVQVYPSRAGGCEMYVTKLGIFSDKRLLGEEMGLEYGEDVEEDDIRIKESGSRGIGGRDLKKSSYITSSETGVSARFARAGKAAFRFERLDLLLGACKRLLASGFSGESSAYFGDGAFYLLFDSDKGNENLLSEYANELDAESFEIYIGEYGNCICKHEAVSTLSELI